MRACAALQLIKFLDSRLDQAERTGDDVDANLVLEERGTASTEDSGVED